MIKIPGPPKDRSKEYFAVVQHLEDGPIAMAVIKFKNRLWYTVGTDHFYSVQDESILHHYTNENVDPTYDSMMKHCLDRQKNFRDGLAPDEDATLADHAFFMGYFNNVNGPRFQTALDLIVELCDVLERHPTNVETVGNAIMNALSFVQSIRGGTPMEIEGGTDEPQ